MRQTFIFPVVVLVTALVISCESNNQGSNETVIESAAEFDLAEMKEIIKEKSEKFTQAHITRDTAFLNNIFTRDANGYPPNSGIISGRDAIAAVNLEWVNYGIEEFTESTTSFYGNEEYLIDEGTYYLRYGEEDIIDQGKYINIWKKEDGEWKICSNIWNTSLPIEAAGLD